MGTTTPLGGEQWSLVVDGATVDAARRTVVGPKQCAWIAAGYRYFFDDGLVFPLVLAPAGEIPVAGIPAFARGECLEMMFGWCMADLREQRDGWLGMLCRLMDLAPATPPGR